MWEMWHCIVKVVDGIGRGASHVCWGMSDVMSVVEAPGCARENREVFFSHDSGTSCRPPLPPLPSAQVVEGPALEASSHSTGEVIQTFENVTNYIRAAASGVGVAKSPGERGRWARARPAGAG